MVFANVSQLIARFKDLGAERIFCKHLAENDNSKQQIYLGGNFEVLSFFPHGEITAFPELKFPNFKATLDFYWVDSEPLPPTSEEPARFAAAAKPASESDRPPRPPAGSAPPFADKH